MTADDWAWPRREPVPMTPETLIKTVGAKNGTVPVEVALRAVRMARPDATADHEAHARLAVPGCAQCARLTVAADSLRSRATAVREQAAAAGAGLALWGQRQHWTLAGCAFQVYVAAVCTLIAAEVLLPRRRQLLMAQLLTEYGRAARM